MPTAKTKVIVLLEDEESALLKKLAAESRRTMGQELAFRAFEELRKANLTTKTAPRRRSRKEAA